MTYDASVLNLRKLTDQVFVLTIACPEIAQAAKAGQFIQVKTSQLLRRPFAIMQTNKVAGTIEIGIQMVGQGTKELSQAKVGDVLSVMGPLGNSFPISEVETALIVGGGSGIFPLIELTKAIKNQGHKAVVFLGFRSPDRAFLGQDFRDLADDTILCSEQGGLDATGYVTDAVADYLKDNHQPDHKYVLYACGPLPLLEKLVNLAKDYHLPNYISLEVRMGCGFGVCRGCPVDLRINQSVKRVRCCVEGPIFPGDQVVFETMRGELIGEDYDG